ncbi:hypothetical protein RXS61_001609 [Shigella sonnei]|nr:hypothetical protein [Shigella sonnei]
MAKSPAERKREQRERERAAARHAEISGHRRIVLTVSEYTFQQIEMARHARRPGAEPYGIDEYFELLAVEDTRRLQKQMAELSQRQCSLCGDTLPGDAQGCIRRGEHGCGQDAVRRLLMLKTM